MPQLEFGWVFLITSFPNFILCFECQSKLILAQQRAKIEAPDFFPRVAKQFEHGGVGIDDSTVEVNDIKKSEGTGEKRVVPVVGVLKLLLRRGLQNDPRSGAAQAIEHREINGRNWVLGE